ncbi:MAG: septation protein A [Pseudomonadota bacterium]
MKLLVDLLPVILFFVVYKFYGDFVAAENSLCLSGDSFCIPGGDEGAIYAATIVAIVAAFIQTGAFWLKHRKFEQMHLITLGVLVLLGGATLAFQDELFIKWKPTIVNWLFAVAFLASHFIGEKTLVQRLMGQAVTLEPAVVWRQLNVAWVVFFVAAGLINIYVAYTFSTDFWVNFKLFGMTGLTFAFIIAQAMFLTRYMVEEQEQSSAEGEEGTQA